MLNIDLVDLSMYNQNFLQYHMCMDQVFVQCILVGWNNHKHCKLVQVMEIRWDCRLQWELVLDTFL